MYNVFKRFDGDVIITDPCYIIKEDGRRNFSESPAWWDFVSKQREEVKDGTVYHYPPCPEDYEDCRDKRREDYRDESENIIKIDMERFHRKYSPTLQAEWDAYHKANAEWRKSIKDDWEDCEYGERLEVLGIHNYLSDNTIYGDWSCTVFNDNKEVLGEFCADSGMVVVLLLEEVLKYNPNFDYHTERTWTTALIKDFHGEIMLKCEEETVTVVGKGNINFVGLQTGI